MAFGIPLHMRVYSTEFNFNNMNKRTILIYGASQGLGRFYYKKLESHPDFKVIGISRNKPLWVEEHYQWILADLSDPFTAREQVLSSLQETPVDVLLYNVGIWESRAFELDYSFLKDELAHLYRMIDTNITSCIFQIQALLPKLLTSPKGQIILTGSTSALDNTRRPEVTFNACKFALRGITQGLRAGFKDRDLAVTLINPGSIDTRLEQATKETNPTQIPMVDLWEILHTLLNLSTGSCPLEINLPSMKDAEV